MKKQTLILDYHPTDLNTYIKAERGNRFAGASIKKTDTDRVYWVCKEQKLKPIKKKVQIDFYWYVVNGRKDPDNIAYAKKAILDGLVKAKVLRNDGMKEIEGFSDHFIFDTAEQVIIDLINK